METRRCPRCHKLLRADSESCSRCGVTLPPERGTRKLATNWADVSDTLSQSTNPPASPHRAGHYSGLHPEDQPFQSSFFLSVKRPDTPIPDTPPVEEDEPLKPTDEPEEYYWEKVQLPPEPDEAGDDKEDRALADVPTLYPTHVPARLRSAPARQRTRVFPILLAAALISFLLASGLLAFLLVSKSPAHSAGPQLVAMPGELRVGDSLQLEGSGFHTHSPITLTRDDQVALLSNQGTPERILTNAQGNFQARITVTTIWKPGVHILHASDAAKADGETTIMIQTPVAGPPRLDLGSARLDLGTGNPGSISHKNITLTNSGGGQITWKARSNVAWLSLSPISGTFAGSELVVLTVDRTNLAPQAYLGQIIFTPDHGTAQTLYVSMTVDATPANLTLSTAALSFTGTTAASPAGQNIVIQNSGGQTLTWEVGSSTSDGSDWLSVTPDSGQLDTGTSAILTVNVNTLKLAPGSYQGTLSLSYAGGPQQQVAVALTVNPPPLPVISVSPASLSFSSNQGFNPAPQSFTISNTGNAQLDWSLQKDLNGQLYLKAAPAQGSLAPGQSVTVTVTPTPGSAGGPINSTLTVLDSDSGTTVTSQQVQIKMAITSEPVINLLTGNLEFDHTAQASDTSEFVIFNNTGNLPLNWSMVTNVPASWLSFDTSSGTLGSGDFAFVTLRCVSTGMKPGTYTVTVTLKDTDAHTVVASRTFTVTLIIS